MADETRTPETVAPSEWAKREAHRLIGEGMSASLKACGVVTGFPLRDAIALALDAARSGEQRLREAIEDEAREQDRKALRADYHDDHADGPLYHSYAARVLRSLLSDAPEAGREEK